MVITMDWVTAYSSFQGTQNTLHQADYLFMRKLYFEPSLNYNNNSQFCVKTFLFKINFVVQ